MESLLRTGLFMIIGGILIVVNFLFVQAVLQSFFQRGVVIAPFDIIGNGGSPELGRNLANLLQARLRQLQKELQQTQSSLTDTPGITSNLSAESDIQPSGTEDRLPPPLPVLWVAPVNLNAALFVPVDINVSVGGIELGRLVPWLQRLVMRPQILNFTVSYEDGKAVIAGDIQALNQAGGSIWMETEATKPTKLADLLAHELVRRILSTAPKSQLGSLDYKEFQTLTTTLATTSMLNDKIARGRPVKQEFAALLPRIENLAEKVPDWNELQYLTALIAENSGELAKARQLQVRLEASLRRLPESATATKELRDTVEKKILELRTKLPDEFYTGLGKRIVELTGIFEVGTDVPEKVFGNVSIFGSDDIHFGAAFWNFKTKTLSPLLLEFQKSDPRQFEEAFGPGIKEIEAVLGGTNEDGNAFARKISEGNRMLPELWRSRFMALGRVPLFQDVQVRTLEPFFKKTVLLMDQYGLRTERGLALCYNIIIQMGGIHNQQARETMDFAFSEFEKVQHKRPDEVESMHIITQGVIETLKSSKLQRLNPSLITNATARYSLFVTGHGHFLGKEIDLEEHGIRLVDFRTGEPLQVKSRPR